MKLIALALLLFSFSRISEPLGGALSAIISFLTRIPLIGRVFKHTLLEPFCLWGIIKPIAWAVSGGNAAIGLWIYVGIFGTPNSKLEYLCICIIGTVSLARLASRFVTFDILSPEQHLINASHLFKGTQLESDFHSVAQDSFIQQRLIRSTFIDLRISEFIAIGSLFGIIYYACGMLGFFGSQLTWGGIYEPMLFSFAKASLIATTSNSATGTLWYLINAFHSLLLLVWGVGFFALSSSLIPVHAPLTPTREFAMPPPNLDHKEEANLMSETSTPGPVARLSEGKRAKGPAKGPAKSKKKSIRRGRRNN